VCGALGDGDCVNAGELAPQEDRPPPIVSQVIFSRARRGIPRFFSFGRVMLCCLLVAACGGSKQSYVQQNEHLLRQIPLPPGARVIRVSSAPYYPEGGSNANPSGYTTDEEVTLRGEATSRSLLRFYQIHLRAWQCRRETGVGPAILNCRKGRAHVNVNLANIKAHPPTYDITVDHDEKL
jgi:hypothetical protein